MVVARVFGKSSAEAVQRERDRLAALQQLDLLDTPRDEGFERIVRLIKDVFFVDIGIVSLIDAHRQWYKACSGLSADEVSLEDTFCRCVVDCDEPVIVQDASKDARFSKHSAVTGEDHIRFYAGVPLRTKAGHMIGTVCAIDRRPRSFSNRELGILQELTGAAMDRIELMQSAATDSLTEAMTRRAFKQEADQLISLALRHQHDLSCIVFDIDHFKHVNDTYGHAAGDGVLKAVASICKSTLRAGDLFGRIGGEEFAVVLPHVDREGAVAVAEKLRAAIAAQPIFGDHGTLNVTASLGSSALSIVSKDIETLLAQADAAMYRAKDGGRNRCVSWNSIHVDHAIGARRRVLKAGSILFNDRRSTIDCTVKSIGADSAGISVSNTAGIPSEFILAIKGEGFETSCRVIGQDRQNLEVAFR
ncbi:sensor domain-containing diguanylate cyclase [Rhizobium lentis]|uniref:diguanylate cyclase n=1 Tax=Rhizobium lentis TaxID=1138194 RepID=A0A9Q3M4A6_9HYPH|nr:sensor domain-containing diguanylate cyclase [Rhizobium lentis]MBX5009253.1 sensor domain-containing diguanylate cyclase [Rhizobium lentis]MBX5021658.1 sensor domain-containing diguanylate cyclase [Rhizobium lentis]MBX5100603.1 sensor domain-containing diguanylate cyclase [Rhizobium lentis]